jgi:hypothetical protein
MIDITISGYIEISMKQMWCLFLLIDTMKYYFLHVNTYSTQSMKCVFPMPIPQQLVRESQARLPLCNWQNLYYFHEMSYNMFYLKSLVDCLTSNRRHVSNPALVGWLKSLCDFNFVCFDIIPTHPICLKRKWR